MPFFFFFLGGGLLREMQVSQKTAHSDLPWLKHFMFVSIGVQGNFANMSFSWGLMQMEGDITRIHLKVVTGIGIPRQKQIHDMSKPTTWAGPWHTLPTEFDSLG